MNQLNPLPDDELLALLMADAQEDAQATGASRTEAFSPLSFAQQRLWLLQQFEPDSAAYNLPRAVAISGTLDVRRLERALQAVVARHDILRTRFFEVDGVARQQVDPRAQLKLERLEAERPADVERLIREDAQRPFDLAHAPLLRASLVKIDDARHVLLLNMHHIVSDAWSNPILMQDLVHAWDALDGANASLPRPALQYADHARWQRETYPSSSAHQRAEHHWRAVMADGLAPLALPLDFPRTQAMRHPAGQVRVDLPKSLVERLQAFSQQRNIPPFVLLLGAWQILLGRYSGQRDFAVGVPNAGRSRAETQALVGFFVNSQVYRAHLDSHVTGLAFLRQLREQSMKALEHADYPVELLLDKTPQQRNPTHNPLFQTLFNWRVTESPERLRLGTLTLESLPTHNPQSKFDLSIDVDYHASGIAACLEYSAALFRATTVERLARHWQNLIGSLLDHVEHPIGELAMLDPDERVAAIAQGVGPVIEHPWQTVAALVTRQALQTPGAVALAWGQKHLSYAELEGQANHLAHRLVACGVRPDTTVGLCAERGPELVVGMLAVLKAGGAYVPLDPNYPDERLRHMVQDSGMALLLASAELASRARSLASIAVEPLTLFDGALPQAAPVVAPQGDNLAYLIYTSGSTGQPKGVEVRQRALSNHMAWMRHAVPLHADDRVLQKTAIGFDASVWEFWLPLISGAQLVLASPGLAQDMSLLWEEVAKQRISVLQAAPSLLKATLPQAHRTQLASLRMILAGGEALSASLIEQLRSTSAATLINLYGPTEATIDSSWKVIDSVPATTVAPLGSPIDNVSCHVLDQALQPCPEGAVGELCIAGVSLARGYRARPGLTAERFVPDPLGADGDRLYRTGDLARRTTDGELEYLGRADQQVKINGLRIEPGEIEACLLLHPAVRHAVVEARETDAGQRLVAWIATGREDAAVLDSELRAHLRQALPAWMVPTHLIPIPALPLTSNGKLDRRALPMPAHASGDSDTAFASELEQRIAHLWQDVLKHDTIDAEHNFFELGGDSIVAIQLVSRARLAGIRFTPNDVFQQQTVRALARVAREQDDTDLEPHRPAVGEVPLTPIQRRFFSRLPPQPQHWNQSVSLRAHQPLDGTLMEQALQAVLQRHDTLRLAFSQSENGWISAYRPLDTGNEILWQAHAETAEALRDIGNRLQRSLDLEQGPLLRGALVDMAEEGQRLLLVIHHLVVDGVSWRMLFDDLQSAYQQLLDGKMPHLPPISSSYQAWSQQLSSHALSPAVRAQLPFWREQMEGMPDALPSARIDAPLHRAVAGTVETRLDSELTRQLLQEAPHAYRTQINDLLLTALARVVSRWSATDSAWILLEGHGREALFDTLDLTRSVGWFTSLYPVRLRPTSGLGDSLKRIKEQLRSVPDKGLGYGLLRYLAEEDARQALAALTEPRITFNYLGQFDGSFDAGDNPLLTPSDDDIGDEQDAQAPLGNWLTLNGRVYRGELSVSWTFSRSMFDEHIVQRLADDYATELRQLIAHCLDPEHHGITPSDFPLATVTQRQLDALATPARQIVDLYPLSPMQQGMLFHTLYEGRKGDYVNQMRVDTEGLDVPAFLHAWQATLDSHEVLRSGFAWQEDLLRPLQVVHRPLTLPYTLLDWQSRAHMAQALDELARDDHERGFDLRQPPLLRLTLVRTAPRKVHLIYTSHHILLDGWSTSRLLGEVLQRYHGQPVPSHPGRYRDYIAWLLTRDPAHDQTFWRERLDLLDEPTLLAQALQQDHAPAEEARQAECATRLDAGDNERLQALARECRVTLSSLLQAAWAILLQRYTGQACVAFGATVSGRPAELPGIEQQVGLFINTLPIILRPRAEQPLSAFLAQVQEHGNALRDQEHVALADIQRWAGRSGSPLFDTLLVLENFPVSDVFEQQAPEGLDFQHLTVHEQTNYPLTLIVNPSDTLSLRLRYDTAALAGEQVARLARHFLHLLSSMVETPQAVVAELPLLDADEQRHTLATWNPHTQRFAPDAALHTLIAAQAARRPDAIAVSFDGQALSYAQLDQRANALAHALVELGVGPDVRVGLATERSLDMLVGLLAILKAGGAYVPLDPVYPEDRLAYMIDDSGIRLLLAQRDLLGQLPVPQALPRLALEDFAQATTAHPPQVNVHPHNLAYVIYTSGSTGKPKGALLTHHNVCRLFHATADRFRFDEHDVWTLFHSYAFDFSVWEIFGALLHGARLLVVPHTVSRAPEEFLRLLVDEGVTVLNQTPSAFRQLVPLAVDCTDTLALRYVVFGGEALDVPALRPWFERFGDQAPQLVNMYGITETTVHVTWRPIARADLDHPVSPIGSPIGDLRWFILDADLNPVPAGCVGELYIGGDGLARGYHQRHDLTATRFVPDPFDDTAGTGGQRLYRTGDLARYRADGGVDYIGRSDHQVKIRGFRIELGEIEAQLLHLPGVRHAVVLPREHVGSQQLVAYLVPEHLPEPAEQPALREAWRQQLKAHLPDYMVPAHLLLLDHLPLTANGKLDRNALPPPEASQALSDWVAPQGPLEQRIATLWQDVLKRERVGATDNFFELGGDSIISIQLVSRARQADLHFTPRQLFEHQTVQALARVVEQTAQAPEQQRPAASGPLRLLPIHQHFFDTDIPQRHHWNQSVLLRPTTALRADVLERALHALLEHHDALRLAFEGDDAEHAHGWRAHYQDTSAEQSPLWHAQVADSDAALELHQQAQRSLDLTHGPLLRAVLSDWPDGSQRLLLVIHHLVVDGVSWRILFEDLQQAYRQVQAGDTPRLPPRTSSLKDWAERLHTAARDDLAGQAAYWQAQLQDVPTTLPGARPGACMTKRHATAVQTRLDSATTLRLLQQAPAAYRTQVNDLLLTALARTLARWTGQLHVTVQLEGHGREELFGGLDLTRTVGWFTSLFPVRLTSDDDLATALITVKEQLRAVPDKGLGFGVLRYLGDEPLRQRLAERPLPRITFNYLGQFDASFAEDEGALFVPAPENPGAEQDADAPLGNWLTLNGQVYAGQLSMNWQFSEQLFDPHTIQALADDYAEQLRALVDHCCDPERGRLTPSDVPLAGLSQTQLDDLPFPARDIADVYPLSPMQQGMLFHTLYETQQAHYVNQLCLDAHHLDPQRFQHAWETVLDRHEALRAAFVWPERAEQAVQVVLKRVALPFTCLDWRDRTVTDDELRELADQVRTRGFDLRRAPLIDLTLVRTQENRHHLIYTNHHILMDGWSASRVFGEVLAHYHGAHPAPAGGHYRDYIAWLQQRDAQQEQSFWQSCLANLEEPTRLAPATAGKARHLARHGEHILRFDAARTQAMEAVARARKVTLNTLFQGAWLLLLQRYTGQRTVCFGATVAGRPAHLAGIEQQVGLFINTLPVSATPADDDSVDHYLQQVQALNLALREHEYSSLADIQRWAGHSGTALFDTLLVFENYPVSHILERQAGERLRFEKTHQHEQTSYPLTVLVNADDTLSVQFSHDLRHFDAEHISRLARHFETVLDHLCQDPQRRLRDICLLDADEQHTQLVDWNATAADYPLHLSVQQLIAQQVANTPDAPALAFGDVQLSYAELDRRANRLAHRLIEQGVGPEVRVGIAAERSVELVVGLLAVLKAGGAYVPLDPEYPTERLAYMIEDSGIGLLLTQQHLRDGLPLHDGLPVLLLDALDLEGCPRHDPQVPVHPENLAYVIYTSGSTGTPKGAGNRHRALTNRLCWMQQAYRLGARDTVLQKTPFSFDVSVWEFFWPLMTGARLALAGPGEHRDPASLVRRIDQYGVTTLHFVPSMLQAFLQDARVSQCTTLTRIVCSGEALPVDAQQQVFAKLPNASLYNLYGPTEAAIDVTHWTCREEGVDSVPIGQPIANLATYVLDAELQPVPVGAIGELYLGGVGLARGYHARPALTAERFVVSPFGEGERLYRSGDLASQRGDGVIEYRGRIDHQVKLRGLRIELGEIEARLLELPEVREAVVVAHEGRTLVGYVAAEAREGLRERLAGHLAAHLPEYMVPSQWVVLECLPLSANGKLDRKALPAPDQPNPERLFIAPTSDLQRQVAHIWSEVLGVERVGLSDHFFELGGHSLLAIRVISRVQLECAVRATPEQLFQFPTLEAFCAALLAQGDVIDNHKLSKLEALLDDMEEV